MTGPIRGPLTGVIGVIGRRACPTTRFFPRHSASELVTDLLKEIPGTMAEFFRPSASRATRATRRSRRRIASWRWRTTRSEQWVGRVDEKFKEITEVRRAARS